MKRKACILGVQTEKGFERNVPTWSFTFRGLQFFLTHRVHFISTWVAQNTALAMKFTSRDWARHCNWCSGHETSLMDLLFQEPSKPLLHKCSISACKVCDPILCFLQELYTPTKFAIPACVFPFSNTQCLQLESHLMHIYSKVSKIIVDGGAYSQVHVDRIAD